MKTAKKVLAGGVCVALLAGMTALWLIHKNKQRAHTVAPLSAETLDAQIPADAQKLMIVAHPDDETLWGGSALVGGGWFVVSVTGGRNHRRSAEFQGVMDESGCTGILLEYPDKVNLRRDDWTAVESGIRADFETILHARDWTEIVTHNPDGEYGHQHHKLTSRYVAEACRADELFENLIYFGRYYSAGELENVTGLTRLTDDKAEKLDTLLSHYASQRRTVERLRHMSYFSDWWVPATDWQTEAGGAA